MLKNNLKGKSEDSLAVDFTWLTPLVAIASYRLES